MKAFVFLILSLVAVSYVSTVNSAKAEPLRNSDIIELSHEKRLVWVRGVFDALGHLAYQSSPDQAQCIWNWLNTYPQERQEFLNEHFTKNPNEVPTSTILVLLKSDCNFQV